MGLFTGSNRREVLFNAAGLVAGYPCLSRAEPFTRMQTPVNMGLFDVQGWHMTEKAMCPAVRLVFEGDATAWMIYDPRCFFGNGNRNRGKAKAIEVSMWGPNGMRANHVIRVD